MDTFHCRVCCGTTASGTYEAREMMFGFRTPFHYEQCAKCGTLWLTDPPGDYSEYYPQNYYSFADGNGNSKRSLRRYLRAKRDGAYFGNGGFLGRYLAKLYEESALLSVSKLGLGPDARLLDVGCGTGRLLHRISAVGFKNLAGVDPFISSDISYGNGIRIRRAHIQDLRGEKYEVVMFHHSLEHVSDPVSTLQAAVGLLVRGGRCLVRLPVVAHAWERYKTNWVQLDPPRHTWIPTEYAMKELGLSAGLVLEMVEYDSTEFQFWGSELYNRGIRLEGINGWKLAREFGIRELRSFRRRSKELNESHTGDQAIFQFMYA